MPYNSIKELPDQVGQLPEHAKEIWMETYNSAYEQYGDELDTEDALEERAARVAWDAVNDGYHKEDGEWVADE